MGKSLLKITLRTGLVAHMPAILGRRKAKAGKSKGARELVRGQAA